MGAKAGPVGASQLDERDGEPEHGEGEEVEEGERIQDVLVPWVLKSKPKSKPKIKSKPRTKSTPNVSASTSTTTEIEIETQDGTAQQGDDVVEENEKKEQEEDEEEEEKVFNRYYHLFIQGELRELIIEAGLEEGYRILPSHSSSSSSSPSSTTTTTTTPTDFKDEDKDTEKEDNEKWLRIRGEGWEADNWWVEAEIGVGNGQ